MNIKNNKNFASVELCKNINLKEILNLVYTQHFKEERQKRNNIALNELDKDDYIEHTFLIDKNHPAGKELHCVTHSGIIFILNEQKYKNKKPCLITIFLARPNQIIRLYEKFNFQVSEYTLKKCTYYVKNKMNF